MDLNSQILQNVRFTRKQPNSDSVWLSLVTNLSLKYNNAAELVNNDVLITVSTGHSVYDDWRQAERRDQAEEPNERNADLGSAPIPNHLQRAASTEVGIDCWTFRTFTEHIQIDWP